MQTELNDQQRQRVIRQTHHFIRVASEHFGKPFQPVDIRFDLKGRSAGMYRVRGNERCIRYNPWIFSHYFQDNLDNTVPHEVAHFIADRLFGMAKIKPHGAEWKNIMQVFGVTPEVTCRYPLDAMPQNPRPRYPYRCQCRTHMLSGIRHNRIRRQQTRYFCKRCKQPLKPCET